MMITPEFSFEFHTEIPGLGDRLESELRATARQELEALAEGHTDLMGASVVLKQLVHAESAYLYQARIVIYSRPDHIAAVEKDASLESALRGALSAAARQIRERRAKLAEYWKRV